MKKFRITISNGQKVDSFTMQAESRDAAYQTARIAHIGTGWDVVQVKPKK